MTANVFRHWIFILMSLLHWDTANQVVSHSWPLSAVDNEMTFFPYPNTNKLLLSTHTHIKLKMAIGSPFNSKDIMSVDDGINHFSFNELTDWKIIFNVKIIIIIKCIEQWWKVCTLVLMQKSIKLNRIKFLGGTWAKESPSVH